MDIRDIEYFAVVAEHRHMGRAAEALGLSQPALSKSVRRLEASVRARLLERTPKGVELTPAGGVLLARVRRLRLALDDVVREISDLGQGLSGQLQIGAGSDTAEDLFSRACARLAREAPKIQLRLTVATFDELLPALRKGELDLIVSGLPLSTSDDIEQEHLYDHEFAVYASIKHRLARRRSVSLSDLAEELWASAPPSVNSARRLYQVFAENALPPPRVMAELRPAALRVRIVAATNLIGFFWKQVARQATPPHRLAELNVPELRWKRQVGLSLRKDAYRSPALLRLMEILRWSAQDVAKEPR